MASEDLAKLAEAMRKQLRLELGDDYNSEVVERVISEATNSTLQYFSDNKSTRSSRSYRAQQQDCGFVFAKRISFLSVKGVYSYNTKALADMFVKNFNAGISRNAEVLNTAYAKAHERKVEPTNVGTKDFYIRAEVKEGYAEQYMRAVPESLFASFDELYEKALSGIDFKKEKDPMGAFAERLGCMLKNTEDEQEALEVIGLTQSYYKDMYANIVGAQNFGEIFSSALAEALKEGSSSSGYDICGIIRILEAKLSISSCNHMYEELEKAPVTRAMTRSVSNTNPLIVNSAREIPKEPTVTTVKGSNGATIKITNYSFYYHNTSNILTMRDENGVYYPNATLDITLPNGEKFSINAGIMGARGANSFTPPISVLENLGNTLGSLKADVLDNFCKEIHYVQIQDINNRFAGMYTYDETMTLTYRERQQGEVISPEVNNIDGYTITHELGHAIDYTKNSESQMKEFEDLFNMIKSSKDCKKLLKDELYALTNFNEFFAEYYTYKQYGTTSKQGQKLFNLLRSLAQKDGNIKKILDGMDRIISGTEKLSKEERQAGKLSPYDIQRAQGERKGHCVTPNVGGSQRPEEGGDVPPVAPEPVNPPVVDWGDPDWEPIVDVEKEVGNVQLIIDDTKDSENKTEESGSGFHEFAFTRNGKEITVAPTEENEAILMAQIEISLTEMFGSLEDSEYRITFIYDDKGNVKGAVVKFTEKNDETGKETDKPTTNNEQQNKPHISGGDTIRDENLQPGYFPGTGINIYDYRNGDGRIDVHSLVYDWEKNGGEVYTFYADEINNIWKAIHNAENSGNWDDFWRNLDKLTTTVGYNSFIRRRQMQK